ncbi:hypothetical protein AAGV28_05570 [Flavobacterium sp. FZUC8N2.13]|uniref:Uncharacterized protein n=1 Tax=Flavobacterium zubiriense TaxID=3138075 RepID=A0ABV4T9R9_9FLAO
MKNILLILIFQFSILTFGQKDSTEIQSIKSTIIVEKKSNISELDFYKLLAEQVQKDNETYISLTQWTLSISFAFLLAIIGSQIFFNYRINKKEIDYIRKDLDEKISELKNDINQSINSKFDDLEKGLKKDMTKEFIEMKKTLFSDFKSHKEYLKLKLEIQEKSLKQDLKALEKEVEQNKGDLWKLKGVESNALSSFVKSASLQIELNRDPKYILDEINTVLGNMEEINSYDFERLNTLSEKTIKTHKEKTEKMISLYKDKPVYEFVVNNSPFRGIGGMGGFPPSIRYIKNKK